MKFSKLIIVDNSLKNTVGHHFEYAKAVSDEAKKQGLNVFVACHYQAEPSVREAMNTLPIFHQSFYDKPHPLSTLPIIGKLIGAILYNYYILRDIRRGKLSTIADSQTIVFIPNCFEILVFGLVLWMEFLTGSSRPRLIILFRRDPRALMSFVGKIIRPMVREGSVMMTTDSDSLATAYEKITHLKFTVLPIPHLPFDVEENDSVVKSESPIRITYLGDARMEKGIDILVKAIPLLSKEIQDRKIEFVIQCHKFSGEAEIEEVISLLEHAQKQFGTGVQLVRTSLSTDEYYRLLKSSDAIVIPYRQSQYKERTSGILAEAFAAGKPVIVTNETWMSEQVKIHGSGILFTDCDIENLANAIRSLIEKYQILSSDARKKSVEWGKIHNAGRLVDLIVSYWK